MQLSQIGAELIFPKAKLFSKQILSDQRFIILALVELLPMMIMNIPLGGMFLFYEVSLYFSIIWGLFFYACFKTPQIRLKNDLECILSDTIVCVRGMGFNRAVEA